MTAPPPAPHGASVTPERRLISCMTHVPRPRVSCVVATAFSPGEANLRSPPVSAEVSGDRGTRGNHSDESYFPFGNLASRVGDPARRGGRGSEGMAVSWVCVSTLLCHGGERGVPWGRVSVVRTLKELEGLRSDSCRLLSPTRGALRHLGGHLAQGAVGFRPRWGTFRAPSLLCCRVSVPLRGQRSASQEVAWPRPPVADTLGAEWGAGARPANE